MRPLGDDPGQLGAAGEGGLSQVLAALYHGHPKLARLFVERGAHLTLFKAAAVGEVGRVRQSLAAEPGAANAVAPDGFGPLGLAAFFGHPEVVGLLLDAGAAVNAPSRNGMRVMPLHSAVAQPHLQTARRLLAAGAEVDAPQQDGLTPLHAAVQNRQLEMVRLLLDHGADPDIAKADGQSARDLAERLGPPELVAPLAGGGTRDPDPK